jgi:hypothetical protein
LPLVIQIVLAVVVLVALIATFLSSKNWHWGQVVLALGLFLAAVGYTILAADVVRIQRNLRSRIPTNEEKLAKFERQNEALLHGSGDPKLIGSLFAGESPVDQSAERIDGIGQLEHRMHLMTRVRGRVWRGVMPAGPMSDSGQIEVTIPKPKPHGLTKETILYAFEKGNPNAASPDQGPQYLGEFRVESTSEGGAVLVPILQMDQRVADRLASSEGPWSLYETMPIDRHDLFAGIPEEVLMQSLPPESVEEYVRQGSPATEDDDQWHSAWFNAAGQRVGPEDTDQHETRRFDRPLRDYAFMFSETAHQRVLLINQARALIADNKKLQDALASAKEMNKKRQQQLQLLTEDLAGMRADRQAIQSFLEKIRHQLEQVNTKLDQTLAENGRLVREYTLEQLALIDTINRRAPAPGEESLLTP